MKKNDERERECPKCGEKVRVMSRAPAAACPNCGEKIPAVPVERMYGEAGKKMEPQINPA